MALTKISKAIYVSIFFLVLSLPIVQYTSIKLGHCLIPRKGLTNVTIKRDAPQLKTSRLLNGKFQKELETWFLRNHGLWGYLVTTENQINFDLFHQISGGYGNELLLGNNNSLFQRMYLEDVNGRIDTSPSRLEKRVKWISDIQNYCIKNGKAFVVLITPSKVAHDPSIVPSWFQSNAYLTSVERDYDKITKLFDQHGINYIDSPKLLKQQSQETNIPTFCPSGAHYNAVGSCTVAKELARRAYEMLKFPVKDFTCGPQIEWKSKLESQERDLAVMMNIWTPKKTMVPTPYITPTLTNTASNATHITTNTTKEERPKFLVIGTSFMWPVFGALEKMGIYDRRFFFYYYKTNYFYFRDRPTDSKRGKKPIKRDELDWEKLVLSNDVIVLEAHEALAGQIGFEFAGDFVKHVLKITE